MLPLTTTSKLRHLSLRRLLTLGIAMLSLGLYLPASAATSASGAVRLESSVSTTTGPLQEAPTNPPVEAPAGSPTGSSSATGSSSETPKQESHERRGHDRASAAGCTVALEAAQSEIAPATPFDLAGRLSCPEGVNAEGQTVTLYQKAAHTPGFAASASTATEANGAFQFALPGVEVDSVFFVRCDGAKSSRVRVKVAPQVDIEAPATGAQLFAGAGRTTSDSSASAAAQVTITGTVSPVEAGATVELQREDRSGGWYFIGRGHVDAEGKFSIVHTFFKRGEAHIRVMAHSHGLFMATASASVTYRISGRHEKASSE